MVVQYNNGQDKTHDGAFICWLAAVTSPQLDRESLYSSVETRLITDRSISVQMCVRVVHGRLCCVRLERIPPPTVFLSETFVNL